MLTASHYNDIASHYESIHPLREAAVEKICSFIQDKHIHGKIIDFGGGTWALLQGVQRKLNLSSERVAVLDASEKMCDEAKQKWLETIHRLFEDTGLVPGSIELAIFHESIHHSEKQDLLRKELKRILAPGGYLLIFIQSDWYIEPACEIINKYVSPSREVRVHPDILIENIFADSLKLTWKSELVSKNTVDTEFVRFAFLNAALSYWKNVEREERKSDVLQIQERGYELVRKVICYEFEKTEA